jgi:hypothetical protein
MVSKKIAVVKIDPILLANVEDFINSINNKFKYANKKQFVDLAVFEKLKKEGWDERK